MAAPGYGQLVSTGLSQILLDENLLKYVGTAQTMYKQNLKCKLALFATMQDKQSEGYCKTIRKNLHRHFCCTGYQRANNTCDPSAP